MNDLLFDTPWWLLAALLGVGAAMWWSGNNRQDRTLKRLGLLSIAVGITLALLSFFVDTDKESVVRRTQTLVKSVNDRDWKTFASILDPHTSFAWYHNRDELVDGAKKSADAIGLKSVRVLQKDVQQTGSVITVDFSAYSEQERTMGRPIVTNWRFSWQNLGTGWRLQSITALPSAQVNTDEITRNLSH